MLKILTLITSRTFIIVRVPSVICVMKSLHNVINQLWIESIIVKHTQRIMFAFVVNPATVTDQIETLTKSNC